MRKRSAVQLIDVLDWRVKTLQYLNLYAGSPEGEVEVREIQTCVAMMLLEMEKILDGEDQHTPRDEGPLGPLSPDILGEKGEDDGLCV